MTHVTSKDGTKIVYSVAGGGPALIVVDGALCYRAFGPSQPLAKELGNEFSVYTYDRRGRGESGDAAVYAPEREVEDLAALVEAAGGSAMVLGVSSGAALSLAAADALGAKKISRLMVYEAPFFTDSTRAPLPDGFVTEMKRHIAAGQRGKAVKMFMRLVGTPAPFVAMMGLMPMFKQLCGVAHTLPYDFAFMARYQQGKPLPRGLYGGATMPVLVGSGGKSPAWMQNSQAQLAKVLPDGRLKTFPGQTHMIGAPTLAAGVREFLAPVAA